MTDSLGMRWPWLGIIPLFACAGEPTPIGGGDDQAGDAACSGQPYAACHQGNVYRFDACGQPDGMFDECRDVLCADGACQPAACDDDIRNGRESDVDCGGGDCVGCDAGGYCLSESDCMSQVCTDRACVAASCNDKVHNGDESATDCGGGCPACADWSACRGDGDCVSGNCPAGTCLPGSCNDGDQNGSESAIDCGGSCAPCPGGSTCNTNDDCQSGDCNVVCAELECPIGMVRIGDVPACIDPFEASVWENSSCTGARYGVGLVDDYPVGFPDRVESAGCAGTCLGRAVTAPTVTVYACGVAGEVPSANITWFQAKRACENAGKLLCTWPLEWLQACWGPSELSFPYGDAYVAGRCNDGHAGNGTAVACGSMTTCQGNGAHDMSGNLWEWTETCVGDDACRSAGGSWAEVGDTYLACPTGHVGRSPDYGGETTGFRCCWRPQ